MKIYILRHEERNIDNPLFLSELTHNGKNNAIKLCDTIKSLNIDYIYCSPFLRVIQTIYPYCNKYNKLINIDNSLYESLNSELFNSSNNSYTWLDLPDEYKNIINKNYKSILDVPIELNETYENICYRVKKFIDNLKITHGNQTILLVTHQTTCNAILHYNNPFIDFNNNINMGEIVNIDI